MNDYKTTKIREMFEKEVEKALYKWRDAKKAGSTAEAIEHLKSVRDAAQTVLELSAQQ